MSDLQSHRVLVVEDSTTMRKIVKGLLEQIGFTRISEASDGAEALRLLRLQPFDLVISDWTMAPMGGLELLCKIRADSQLGATRFIMLTAHDASHEVITAKEAGANGYLVKPFNADRLKAKIETVLGLVG